MPGLTFLHTGIMLRGRNGEPVSIMEVNRELGVNEEVTTLHLKSAYEVYSRGNIPNEPSISVRNEHIQFLGLDIAKILYRYSRIAGLSIRYHITSLNCEVIANWLQTGMPIWQTKTCESSLAHIIKDFSHSEGVVTLDMLYAIEEENHLLS